MNGASVIIKSEGRKQHEAYAIMVCAAIFWSKGEGNPGAEGSSGNHSRKDP